MTLTLTGAGPTSGFDPLSLSPTHWFKSESLSGNDGDAISSWTNSGSAGAATQATGSKQPLLKKAANGINSLSVALFDGVDDFLATANVDLSGSTGITMFAVARLDAAGSFPVLVDYGAVLRLELRYSSTLRKPNYNFDAVGSIAASAVTLATSHVIEGVFDNTADTIFVGTDGTLEAPTSSASAILEANTPVYLGARTGTSIFFQGAVGDVLIFPTALSAGNRSSVRSYLGSKYGITVS